MAPRKTAAAKKTTSTTRTAAKKAAPAKATPRKATAAKAVADAAAANGTEFADFLVQLRNLIDGYLSPIGTTAPADEDDESEDDEEAGEKTREEREEELGEMTARQLQNILIALEYDEKDVRPEKDKDVLVANILDEEYPEDEGDSDEDEEDEADEEGDEDEEEAELDRDDLIALSLAELKKLAVNRYELDASEIKGQDKDTIADMILESVEEGDGDEDEVDGEDEEYWTEEDLQALPIAQVRAIADEAGLAYTAAQGKSKKALIELIVE